MDDTEKTVIERLDVYSRQTEPLGGSTSRDPPQDILRLTALAKSTRIQKNILDQLS